MDLNTILYILGAIVVAYFVLMVTAGVWKGWSAISKIWFYTKKIWWLVFLVIGLVIVLYIMSRKSSEKKRVQNRLDELNRIENKTNADIKETERLEQQKKDIEKSIIDLTDRYRKKVDDIQRKPDDPKPGDAGRSADALKDAWK